MSKLILDRWDYKEHKYKPYEPDPSWKIVIICSNLDEPISCTNCGAAVKYGDTYTSKEIHTPLGFGYPVCTICYQQEIKRWKDDKSE